jgi:hypothetical protein
LRAGRAACGRAGFGASFRFALRAGLARFIWRGTAAFRDFIGRLKAARRRADLGFAALRALPVRAFATCLALGRAFARACFFAGRRLFRFEPLDLAAMWTTPLPLVDLGC